MRMKVEASIVCHNSISHFLAAKLNSTPTDLTTFLLFLTYYYGLKDKQ